MSPCEAPTWSTLGEAEWSLLELVQALANNSGCDPAEIRGVAFAERTGGSIVRTPARPLMKSLDLLPLPARDLADISRYRAAWTRAHGFFPLNLVASRGCPYKCNWCAKPIYGNSFNVRSPESVAEEMLELFGGAYLLRGLLTGLAERLGHSVLLFRVGTP